MLSTKEMNIAMIAVLLFIVFIASMVNGLCPSECSCITLSAGDYVYCNSRSLGHIPDDLPNNTHNLFLQENSITSIEIQFCKEMPQLKYITIYNNQISEIPVNTFVECEFLESLSLHINMIRSIEINTFINMTNLYTLYLHNNKIRSLKSYTFINMTNLQNLQLQNNEISIIESFTFMNLPSLQYLYLFNNEISVIEPFTFVNLPSLQYLYLRNNKIRLLESYTFINTTNVYYINLSENNISHIEEHAFGNFTLLSDLILTSNPLNCDCSIYPFWSWLSERACKVTSAKCSNGTSVTSLQVAALDKCNPNNCQCFNGGTCVMTDIGRMCDCIGHWTGKFCQESQCNSYNCGFGDCYIEPMNGTAQCFCGDRYSNYCPDTTTEEPTTTEIEATTTAPVPSTVQPSQCLDNVEGVNRTDATLDEECGAYSGTAKCIIPNSACTTIDSTWICRCSQGYAKKNGLCTQLPSELFTSKQSSLNLLESSQPGDQVTKIDFTEVQGLYKTKPVAEIIGQDSDVFRVQTVNTEMVIIALDKDLTKPKYEIFVVVSVTADGIVIRDFRHITITVNKDSVIRKEIFIMEGTLNDSVVGLVCQSCLLFENMTQIDRDNIVTVQNDGVIITSKTINLNSIQGSTTIAYSTYVEIQQQFTSVTVANITIHIIRAEFECELPEDSVANTVVGNLKLNIPFSIDSDSEFQISGLSLTLGSVVLDYIEQIKVIKTLSISIGDYTFDTTIMINVQDVNNKSPMFIAKPYNFFTLESAYPGLIVGVVSATDPDTNSDLTYSISSTGILVINNYGIISIQSGFGTNATGYNATVSVTDGLHLVTEFVTVEIEQATTSNLRNKFVGSIPENQKTPILIETVNITNYNNYKFTDRSAYTDFSIDLNTGQVKNERGFDREKETEREFKYTIVANEKDALKCSLVVIGEITITVTDLNDEPPVFASHSYKATVSENANNEKVMVVPEISTTDEDLVSTVAYSISTNTDKFAIDSSTGTITTKLGLDREVDDHLTVEVVATDGANSATATVTVQVLDKNDNTPQFNSGQSSMTVHESSSIGASIGRINATDSDEGKNAEITFDLVSNDGGPFRINQTTGEITVTGKLDRESSETYGVSVFARDNGISIRSSSMSVTITVLDENDNPPVFTIDELKVEFEENKDCSNQIATVSATDADKAGTINSQITYSLLSGTQHFTLDSSGILKCKSTLDYEDKSFYQITVKAQDNGSPQLNSTQNVTINIKDVNDNAPIFESPPTAITIRYLSTATGRVIEVFKVNDEDSGENGRVTFSISGPAAEFLNIDSINGILRTKSDKDDGAYALQVIAMDHGNPPKETTTSVTVTVDKQNSNQRIQFTQQVINMTVKENHPIGPLLDSDVSSNVTKPSTVTLKYEIIGNSSDLAFAVNLDSGLVTLSKPVDRETTDIHEFVVRAKNQAQPTESDLALVRVHIQDENDNTPTFVRSAYFFRVNENEDISTVVAPQNIEIVARDNDIGDNAVIEFQLSGDGVYTECSSAFSLKNERENTRSIQLSKKVDYEVLKKCEFSIEAYNPNNRTMSTSVSVTVDILDYNDNKPVFTGQSSSNVFTVDLLENTTINDPQNFGTVKDADSGANGDIDLTVTNGDCWVDVTKVEGTGEMILRLKENANIDYESGLRQKDCIIKASDKGKTSFSSTVTLSMILIDVNDNRPVIANPHINKSVSRDSDVGNTIIVNSIPATDADSGENGKLGYAIKASEHYLKFAIDADTGKITLNSPLLSVQKDKITIEVIVSDKGAIQLSATATVTIHILDENPRPYFSQSETLHIKEHVPQLNGILSTVTAFDRRSGDKVIECDCTYSLDTTRKDIIIENTTGTIKFKNIDSVLDREGESHGKVIIGVIATDKGSPPKKSKTMPFTIDIVDINDQSPAFEKLAYAFKIPQNAPEGTTIGTVTAIDLDEDPITLYNISIRDNGGYDRNVITIDEMTGKITTSGNLTIRSGQNAIIKGVVFAQDANDTAKSLANSNFEITVEYDYNNKHAPVFQNTPYATVINWNLAAGSPITEVNATDADTGRNSEVTYSITDNSKREFFTVNNDGVISLAYQLDSSLGNDNTVKINLTIIAKDNGIIPKSSTTIVQIRITGENPGVCIQGAEHSKETKELEDERQNWSLAVYVLVGLLCISIVVSFFFVYKWRTSSPVIGAPEDTTNKKTYFQNMEYDELEKRKTVEYSQSNQAFEPPRKDINFTDQDPYQKPYAQAGGASFKTSPYDEPIPDLKASSDEPKPDYPVYDWETKATKVLPPVVPSSFGSSS